MEDLKLFLKMSGVRQVRRQRQSLLQFVDALTLHLEAGYDLSYSWPETLMALESTPLRDSFLLRQEEGMLPLLARLATGYPDKTHRVWFSVLHELYGQGAGLTEAVRAMATTLRKEQARDLEAHCRTLPSRINILLLLFFLPPTLLLLLVPLLQVFFQSFAE